MHCDCFSRRLFCAPLALLLAGLLLLPAGAVDAAPPDLTKGDALPADVEPTWHLGATGARGWMYTKKMVSDEARQIYITEVAKGSPADGVLEVGDVILGVGGERFSSDPREAFGRALTHAESPAGRGQLTVIRWRKGGTERVAIRLPVLGSYSDTAPYNSTKSRAILEQGCEWIAGQIESGSYRRNPIERSLNALALLASGEEKYLPLVKREAEWAAGFSADGFATWWYGYTIMLLSEYVIKTGDTSVMPGLERLALEAARGQSIVGSWGHKFAGDDGRLVGYGMMNAPGLSLTTGLILAREAGVKNPDLDLAIERSVLMLRFYVDKGSIPYGDHAPWIQNHDDNGKNSIAAVMFNLLEDKESAEYFSRMAVACYGEERDTGHTGNFWNVLWALPGVSQSGPNATGAWMDAYGQWYFDSARTHEGNFVHLGPPGYKDKYGRWDATGAYLLAYALPLKQIRLTGKGKHVAPQVSRTQARQLIEDGRGWDNADRTSHYDAMSTGQLLKKLTSWSPVVRERAGMALGRRKAEVVPQVIKLLEAEDLHTRYGACQALKLMRVDRADAVPALRKALDDRDLWLRILAGEALAGIGDPARAAVPDMLKHLAAANDPDDPRGMEQRYLCFSLFNRRGGLLGRSLEGIDRDLLYDAVRVGLNNEDGRARGAVASIYRQLSLEQVRPLLPAIHRAVVDPAPSGIMFASSVRNEGLRVLAQHHVAEGMQAGVDYLEATWNEWGSGDRTPIILKSLEGYGTHAQAIIPQLEKIAQAMAAADAKRRERARNHMDQKVRETIEKIKASEDTPELIRIEIQRVGQAR